MELAHDSLSRTATLRGGRNVVALTFAVVAALGLAAGPVSAQESGGQVIAADQAMQRAAAHELVVVDVRSPEEWRQTGVPAGARLVTIHQPDGLIGFLEEMSEALGADHDQPIALICASGNRSTLASSALAEAGYTQVYNIREGMLGSLDGPGWLARGLPTEPCGKC